MKIEVSVPGEFVIKRSNEIWAKFGNQVILYLPAAEKVNEGYRANLRINQSTL